MLVHIQRTGREAAGWPGAALAASEAVAGATAPRAWGLQHASERDDGRIGLLGVPCAWLRAPVGQVGLLVTVMTDAALASFGDGGEWRYALGTSKRREGEHGGAHSKLNACLSELEEGLVTTGGRRRSRWSNEEGSGGRHVAARPGPRGSSRRSGTSRRSS